MAYRGALIAMLAASMAVAACATRAEPRPQRAPAPRALTTTVVSSEASAEPGPSATSAPETVPPWEMLRGTLDARRIRAVDRVVTAAIRRGEMPGAVVAVVLGGRVVLTKAYGHRSLKPAREPMTVDTLFDLASLSKPMVTATAVMQLVEAGALTLDTTAASVRPAFASHGKDAITVAQLLGHTSGLPDSNPLADYRAGPAAALARIDDLPLAYPPGSRRVYSDLDYIILGALVAARSGESLDRYAARQIFEPLGMASAGYLPSEEARTRAAPVDRRDGHWLSGRVHDMRAEGLGGVAGHAGVFATVDDVTRYVLMLLGDGALGATRVLSPASVAALMRARAAAGGRHGLGLQAVDDGFGHTGFTGTSLWLEPMRGSGLVILTNRLHPDGGGDAAPLREDLRELVRAWAIDAPAPALATAVVPGIEALGDGAALKGRRVGLVTNHSGVTRDGLRSIDVLRDASGVELVSVFAPEHGLLGSADAAVADGSDAKTGLPVYSLYGTRQRPTTAQLAGVDTLVLDLQDAGARFYTYVTTLGYLLEASKQHGLRLVVLDRPNPLGGVVVEGPLLDADRESFIGYHSIPVRHGMTLGELAQLFNAERKLGVDLHVVKMRGWKRNMLWRDTSLRWPVPSPNLRDPDAALLYPGVALLEASNVSVGRGTDHPFELVGAPWVSGKALAAALRGEAIQGVSIEQATFTPSASKHAGARCHGVRLRVTDGPRLQSLKLGIALAHHLRRLHAGAFHPAQLLTMLGDRDSFSALERGASVADVMAVWQVELDAFRKRRQRHLLY